MVKLEIDVWEDDPKHAVEILSLLEGDIEIDVSDAPSVPAQIAQVLLSARVTAHERGAKFLLSNPSDGVKSSLASLGLEILLEEAA